MITALVGLLALAGCVGDPPPPPPIVVDTRMPVTVDYYAHRTLHPPRHHASGRVDPVDPRPDRERNFGPESRAEPAPPSPHAALSASSPRAALAAFRAGVPAAAGTYLALARKHARAKVAKTETARDDDGDVTRDPDAPRSAEPRTADNRGVQDQDGGYKLNFEDAEIKDVLQAVLGNVLGLTYTTAPNITGRITISSSATQSRAELLSTLETVLAMQGLSLTKSGSTYRVAPLSVGGGSLDESGTSPGFGISVVPLEYSSVTSMSKLLGGFVTDADGIRIDTSRNAVIVRGPGPRREEIVRAIKAFDGDWMHTQSVSVVELRRSHPEEVIQELTRIFDADANGNAAGLIQFKAIKRLRSIMIISKNDTLIRRAGSWIRRLDHQDTSATSSIFIYRPRYRDARELTRLVNGLFGQSDSSSSGGGVAFQGQGQNGQSGQGGLGSSSSGLSGSQGSGQGGTIGTSSASFAGGLSSSGLGSSSGIGGQSSGLGGSSPGSSFGGGGSGTSGSGLQGNLADPIEAGQSGGSSGSGGGEKLKLTADASNNTVVAYTDGETYAKVKAVLTQLDLPPLQVAINVIIAEVQLNDELKYGIQFYLNNKAGSIGLSQTATQVLSSGTSTIPGFNFLVGGASSANVVLSALDSISKVHILSTPSIVVMENKPATFEVGNQVPVVTQQATSTLTADAPTLNQVTYLDTGIILKIVPRVGQNGDVAMDLDQVISSVVPDAAGSTTASLTPTISKRRIASDISVRSGQSVLLAGLINDTRQQSRGQVPFIGPGLGNIFGNTDNQINRTELVVFIRPVIIRDGQDAASVAEEFRGGLSAMRLQPPPVYKP